MEINVKAFLLSYIKGKVWKLTFLRPVFVFPRVRVMVIIIRTVPLSNARNVKRDVI